MSIITDKINESNNIVVLTGIGVSNEVSNLLYKVEVDGDILLSKKVFYSNPNIFWKYYKKYLSEDNIKPSIVYNTLAKLEEEGKIKCIITQNIDGLHQMAGSKNVLELHGNGNTCTCTRCGITYDDMKNRNSYKCVCGGIIKPNIVLFGERCNSYVYNKAIDEVKNADLLLVLGNPLEVVDTYTLVLDFIGNDFKTINDKLIIINSGKTLCDEYGIKEEKDLSIVFDDIKQKVLRKK